MTTAAGLDDALQDLSEAAGLRLTVLDWTMAVVSYSIHETDDDRHRLSLLLAHSGGWDPPALTSQDHIIEELPQVGRCLLIPLTDHRRRVGYLLTVVGGAAVPPAALSTLLQGRPVSVSCSHCGSCMRSTIDPGPVNC
ncbi:hypothetical protein GTV32_03930 [Gordonia sp. SID5947]|uniref:hypothetical protein n=1 Tax=Gordonia sp. SID5947 TaxID=2690315 RepID=UPI001367B047|nr:hypothetical protein [Gordonia sp. SID5947]MYR05514.1 hypothetical protein [Gordonia sp. SID5947]